MINCMLKKNDEFEILITDIGNDGEGIGHYEGMAFFIKGAVIGDKILAGATKLNKSYGYARVVRVLEPSPYRVGALCPLAGPCGGCQLQHISYDKQLEFKQNKVKNDLIRLGGIDSGRFEAGKPDSVCFHDIIGMNNPINYRNKGQFPVGCDKNGKTVVGFYAGHTHSIIDTDSCLIQHGITDYIMRGVRRYMAENSVSAYDGESHGLIRHILTRVGFRSHEVMVCVVINGRELPKWERLQTILEEEIKGFNAAKDAKWHSEKAHRTLTADETVFSYKLASLSVNINTENTNVIMGEKVVTLAGRPYITDYIGDVQYQISPLSFYQVNPLQTEVLYRTALRYAGLSENPLNSAGEFADTSEKTAASAKKGIVWDLYCGIGTISLFLAKAAKQVYGVEIIPQAVADAKRNAEINNILNAEFFTGAAEEVLPRKYESDSSMKADVIVVDPPRKGCDERLLATAVKMNPERIVYVSCDPATMSRDIKFLEQNGYVLREVQPVDQFPFSVHVETVVCLSQQKPDDHIEIEIDLDAMRHFQMI